MDIGAKEILLVLLGFVLAHLPKWFDRKRNLKAHWCAIRAEMELCKEIAEGMRTEPRQTPLYRLPVTAFDTAFPILLAEATVTEAESQTLSRFSGHVHDINRGLDNAAEMYKASESGKLEEEFNRNLLKAKHLVEGYGSIYHAAKGIVDAKISRRGWWY